MHTSILTHTKNIIVQEKISCVYTNLDTHTSILTHTKKNIICIYKFM